MQSANLNIHHHELQDHQLVASSSPSSYGVAVTPHAYLSNSSSLLNTNNSSSYPSETSELYNTTSMAQDLIRFNWADSTGNLITNQSAQDLLHLPRIKEGLGDTYHFEYPELLSSRDQEPNLRINLGRLQLQNDLSTKVLLKPLSSGNLLNSHENDERGFSQVFPSVNVSNSNQNGLTSQGLCLDMNLEALDLLTSSCSSRLGGNIISPSLHYQIEMMRDCVSFGLDHHMQQQSHQYPMYSIKNKISSSSVHGVAEAKRSISKMEAKQTNQTATKKSRVDARPSCPPLKVRKEKLGDRIAALQQLVAPFGKTDTASVLMEAIGYIKFLQSQVETLSVPYMKAARDKCNRLNKGNYNIKQVPLHVLDNLNINHASTTVPIESEGEEPMRDLKSRGLCLIPLPCLSNIADHGHGGAAVWPPPYFGGAT